jgi:hypothetical protein
MLSRVMQADVVIWPLWCNTEEIYKTWAFRKEYGIGDAGVEFHPYWEQREIGIQDPNSGPDPSLVAGYYGKTTGELLLLVSNLDRQSRTAEIDFGTLEIEAISDAETGEALSLDAEGRLVLEMPRNNYRALRVDSAATTATAVFVE